MSRADFFLSQFLQLARRPVGWSRVSEERWVEYNVWGVRTPDHIESYKLGEMFCFYSEKNKTIARTGLPSKGSLRVLISTC